MRPGVVRDTIKILMFILYNYNTCHYNKIYLLTETQSMKLQEASNIAEYTGLVI